MAAEARKLGAKIIVCHGETITEPVIPGTNKAALEADIDILAHPGFITPEEALLAKKGNILLELSGRKGHSLTNGHVLRTAQRHGVPLVINSDGHSPDDFMSPQRARDVGRGAGLSLEEVEKIYTSVWERIRSLI